MDVVDNITKVKKKKLERDQIVRDVETQLGLSADDYVCMYVHFRQNNKNYQILIQ